MSKKAKRRSLLPQFNRKVSNEDKHEHGGIKEEDEEDGGDGYRPCSSGPTRLWWKRRWSSSGRRQTKRYHAAPIEAHKTDVYDTA